MIYVGDIHGHFGFMKDFALGNPEKPMIQVGDFGIGFGEPVPELPSNLKFIRGNHDDPELCQASPNYLGDFGMQDGIFFAGGADSIDKLHRKRFISWWPNEQLTYSQQMKAMDLYRECLPRIVVTHDCPDSVCTELFQIWQGNSTRSFLQELLEIHKPQYWIFGHHHKSRCKVIQGTTFHCLAEFEAKEIL